MSLLLLLITAGLVSLLNLLEQESQLLNRLEHVDPPTTRTLLGPRTTLTMELIGQQLAARTSYPKFPKLITALQRIFPKTMDAIALARRFCIGLITLTLLGWTIMLIVLFLVKLVLK